MQGFFTQDYLKTYNVFDITPQQVTKFENYLENHDKLYPNFIRQYNEIMKNGKHLLVAQLVSKNLLENNEDWKQKPIIIIDACKGIRSIVYNLDKDKLLWDRNGGGCP